MSPSGTYALREVMEKVVKNPRFEAEIIKLSTVTPKRINIKMPAKTIEFIKAVSILSISYQTVASLKRII